MRASSILAGVLALVISLAVLSWVVRPTQKSADGAAVNAADLAKQYDEAIEVDAEEQAKRVEAAAKSDVHTANPFTLSQDGPQPKAVVDESTYNFDRLAVNATGTHDFVFRNEGDAPLKLAKGESTCKCTGFSVGEKGEREIAPGESASIGLQWEPKQEATGFAQSAVVWTNDPNNPKIELRVEGDVFPFISTVPQGTWTFGMLTEGSPATVHGRIASYLQKEFEITSVETPSDKVTVTYEPLPQDELERIRALSGYQLTCTVDSDIPVGVFAERVKVHTTLEEAPQVQFTLAGSRSGPFQVIGPGWTQSYQLMSMGRCKAAEGKTTQLSYFVAVPAGVDFSFGQPEVTPPILNISVSRDESFNASNGRERHIVQIEAPAGLTPGRWMGDEAIKVVLPCNHPYASSATFHVALQVD